MDYRSMGVCIVPSLRMKSPPGAPGGDSVTAEGYKIYTAGDYVTATAILDGVDVSDQCTAACPEGGWADLLLLDERGHVQADEENNVLTKRVYGKVIVELSE